MRKSPASTSDRQELRLYRARILIRLRPSILDPQGKAVHHALESLGMEDVREVRIGKYIEMSVAGESRASAETTAQEACRRLLANPVMEDFSLTVETVAGERSASPRRKRPSPSHRAR